MSTAAGQGIAGGTDAKVAVYTISEGAETRELQRVVASDSAGAELSLATAAKQDTGNSSLSSIATNTAAGALETGGNLASLLTATGATGDAAVSAGATGSISAKLRSISRDIVANIVLAAGTALIGKVGIDQTTPGTTNAVALPSGAVASGAIAAGAIAAGATSIADNEDVGSADGDRGVKILAIRSATPADTSGSDLDYEMLRLKDGYLWVATPKWVKVSANFTAAGTTPSYTSGEWISDNGTAGSVTKISWSIPRSGGVVRRVRIRKSDQTVATPTIRLYLWDATFTVAVGNDASGAQPFQDSIGLIDVPVTLAGNDDAVGYANCDIPFSAATLFGLIQSQSSFTGATSEVWTIDLWYLPS